MFESFFSLFQFLFVDVLTSDIDFFFTILVFSISFAVIRLIFSLLRGGERIK